MRLRFCKALQSEDMAKPPYRKAPITEALIDIRVEMLSETTLSTLLEIYSQIQEEYPIREEMFAVKGKLEFGSSISTTTSQTAIGYRFISTDGQQILQARLDGFTFSRIAPYEAWDLFRDEAYRLWHLYKTITNFNLVKRVAIRYVNRLDLPHNQSYFDFKDYLRTVPEVSTDLPQGLSGYFMQLQIPQDDLGGILVLNQALVPPEQLNTVSVLLDIDVYCLVDFSKDNDDACWNLLEKLRQRKNEIFEACITDKTREVIK